MTESLGYLLGRAAAVEQRVRELVPNACCRPAPDDPFRGLYLTDDVCRRAAALRPAAGVASIMNNSPNWT